jgi:citrate lyase beta subunit
MIRRIARCSMAVTACALVALAFAAGPLHADLGGPSPDSWSRLLHYAGCALGIVAASTGLGLAAAVVACVRVLFLTA